MRTKPRGFSGIPAKFRRHSFVLENCVFPFGSAYTALVAGSEAPSQMQGRIDATVDNGHAGAQKIGFSTSALLAAPDGEGRDFRSNAVASQTSSSMGGQAHTWISSYPGTFCPGRTKLFDKHALASKLTFMRSMPQEGTCVPATTSELRRSVETNRVASQ